MDKTLMPPKILVVSNLRVTGPMWVASLQLQQQIKVILEPDPEKTIQRWKAEYPDLVILDVNLPQDQIIRLIQKLRDESSIPILLLTVIVLEEFLVEAYRAGADECILKPIGHSLFHEKVKVWLQRSGFVPAETLETVRVGAIQLLPAERLIILNNGSRVQLTSLELRFLYCLMSQPGHTMAIEGLIRRVWGSNYDADSTALKNIAYRLRQKIESDPANPRLLQTVTGIGYKFIGPG